MRDKYPPARLTIGRASQADHPLFQSRQPPDAALCASFVERRLCRVSRAFCSALWVGTTLQAGRLYGPRTCLSVVFSSLASLRHGHMADRADIRMIAKGLRPGQ
jgi:hypothetical protein